MRVAIFGSASAAPERRTLAGRKALKWRSADQPQEGKGVRKNVLLCGRNSALKGNPKGGTGMKQGRQKMGGSRP
jgi:hypothetical protein